MRCNFVVCLVRHVVALLFKSKSNFEKYLYALVLVYIYIYIYINI